MHARGAVLSAAAALTFEEELEDRFEVFGRGRRDEHVGVPVRHRARQAEPQGSRLAPPPRRRERHRGPQRLLRHRVQKREHCARLLGDKKRKKPATTTTTTTTKQPQQQQERNEEAS
jgi:hypothetical protein